MTKNKEEQLEILEDQHNYADGCQFAVLDIQKIAVSAQVRSVFDGEDSSLDELAKSIGKIGVMQPIHVCPTSTGYALIAGERRLRASKLAGKTTIPALIKQVSSGFAEDMQFAENVHRLNLSQIEEAKKLQKDVEELGTSEAVAAKHGKTPGWVSKRLALLKLPDQAKRLISESICADLEIINSVKTIEKKDPEKAKALVDDLKKNPHQTNAREKVAEVKEQVKPSKAKAKKAAEAAAAGGGIVATPKDTTNEMPGEVTVVTAGRKLKNAIFEDLTQNKITPSIVLGRLSESEKDSLEECLFPFFKAATDAPDPIAYVIGGMRQGLFSVENNKALALSSALAGVAAGQGANLSLFDVFKGVSNV